MIAIADNNQLNYVTTNINEENEMMWVIVKANQWKFRIGIVYGKQETQEDEEALDQYYYELEKEYATGSEEPTLLIGDFNAHIGNDNEGIPGNHSKVNRNGINLRSLVKRRNLTIVNKLNFTKGKLTREEKASKSIIDYVAANEEIHQQ